jgi:uncharacterized phage protein (TIGR02218 family)
MPKPLSPGLWAHYQLPVQTLTRCLRIARQDGQVLGFTEHDQDLVFEGVVYRSAAGYTPTVVQSTDQGAVGSVEIEGLLVEAGVDKQAIAAGLFDQAQITLFEVNYSDLSQGKLSLFTGFWGETRYQGNRYVTELRSLAEVLQQPCGAFYSLSCRAQLGDQRCQVDVKHFTHAAVVSEVLSPTQFFADPGLLPAGYFEHGVVTWQTGNNKGLVNEINTESSGLFQLMEAPVYPLHTQDTFLASAGCDKQLSTCQTRFHNTVNFRGEPFVPGLEVLRYPDAK